MIANPDGSIVLSTKVDNSGMKKGINNLKNDAATAGQSFSRLGGIIAAAFSIRAISAFKKEAEELYKAQLQAETKLETIMRGRIGATDEEIKKIKELTAEQQRLGIIGDEVQLAGAQQLATFAKTTDTLEILIPAMNNLVAQQYGYEASAESTRNIANLLGKALQGQTSTLRRVGITFDEEEEKALKYGNELERAAILAKVITNNVGEMNTALANTEFGKRKQIENTFGDIKEQIGEAFITLGSLFLPALQVLANSLSKVASIAQVAAANIAQIFGKKTEKQTDKAAKSTKNTVKNIEDITEATKEAGKAAQGQLASFDEINTITKDTASASQESAGADISGLGISPETLYDPMEEAKRVDEALTFLMGVIGEALVAVGVLLLFLGGPAVKGIGIGCIIAGIVLFGISAAALAGGDVSQDAANMLDFLMGVVGGALVAIGIVLIMLGSYAWGIGCIIAGVVKLGVAVAHIIKYKGDDVKQTIALIMGIASGAMLALGIMLLIFSGPSPLSIGLIAAGALLLAISVAQLATGKASDKVKFWINTITAIASTAMLALGIILCATGVNLPLGIALIAAGAVGLVGTIALNWNAIVDKIKKVGDSIAKIFKNVWEGIKSGFKAMVNGIIGFANKWIDGLNLLLAPLRLLIVGIAKAFGKDLNFSQVKIPHIPKLAKGGIVPYATTAVIGEAGKEAVLPLENNTEWMDILASKIASQMPSNNFSGKIEVPVYLYGREIARASRDGNNELGEQTVYGRFANAY